MYYMISDKNSLDFLFYIKPKMNYLWTCSNKIDNESLNVYNIYEPVHKRRRKGDLMRRKDDTMRDTLLNSARDIADTEGIDAVNIRSIAKRLVLQAEQSTITS